MLRRDPDQYMRGDFIVQRIHCIAHSVHLGGAKSERLQTRDRLTWMKAKLHQADAIFLIQRIVIAQYFAVVAGFQRPERAVHSGSFMPKQSTSLT